MISRISVGAATMTPAAHPCSSAAHHAAVQHTHAAVQITHATVQHTHAAVQHTHAAVQHTHGSVLITCLDPAEHLSPVDSIGDERRLPDHQFIHQYPDSPPVRCLAIRPARKNLRRKVPAKAPITPCCLAHSSLVRAWTATVYPPHRNLGLLATTFKIRSLVRL